MGKAKDYAEYYFGIDIGIVSGGVVDDCSNGILGYSERKRQK
jgi:hypothetical protein